MSKFSYNLTNNVLTVTHESVPDVTVGVNIDSIPGVTVTGPVGQYIVQYGLKALLQDKAKDYVEGDTSTPRGLLEAMQSIVSRLLSGEVPAQRTRGYPVASVSLIVEAIVRAAAWRGKAIPHATAAKLYSALTAEQKSDLRQRPDIKAELAAIQAEASPDVNTTSLEDLLG